MDNELLKPTITTILGLVSGIVLAYTTAILKFRKDLEADFDKDLRNRRLEVYERLWKTLEVLSRYDLPKPLTPSVLSDLTVSMREWYFDKGGMYLSDRTRIAYFELKEQIRRALADGSLPADNEIPGVAKTSILEQASLLRAWLTRDVGTRRRPAIADA